MDGESGVEEVFFSKVSGNFFLEIFEKSIDKHKIDAILICAVQSERSCEGLFWKWAWRWPEDSTEESG